ncbi:MULTISPECIES: hypothetical protein [unclassified Crossiella]|uniref:hypothetical protein n=1 Tax=unclassified Crossiella TaxID=2620835 RepID=UPI001FFEE5F0|nr:MULTISPECIES: hypothetical protein [unclassified Crossiella]MCK2240977.1 hypothetical protein [Crossiella sp. S99.2]MCK2253879.1 hypothetical protein [Crossiella sp. S99.1]
MNPTRLAPTAEDPFSIDFQFAVPTWRVVRASARIQDAVAHMDLDEAILTLHVGLDVLITVTLPCGTIGEALRGGPKMEEVLRAASRFVEATYDLEPVFVVGPPDRGTLVDARLLTVGRTQILRVVYHDTAEVNRHCG